MHAEYGGDSECGRDGGGVFEREGHDRMMVHGQTMRADLSTRGGNLFMRKILRGVTGTESLPLTSVYASSSPMLLMEHSARCRKNADIRYSQSIVRLPNRMR